MDRHCQAKREGKRLGIEDAAAWAKKREGPRLCCERCKKGYADCRCPPSWTNHKKMAARKAEITAIHTRAIAGLAQHKPSLKKFELRIPAELYIFLLEHKPKKVSVSRFLGSLLVTVATPSRLLAFGGDIERLSLRLPAPLAQELSKHSAVQIAERLAKTASILDHEQDLDLALLTEDG